MSWPCLKAKMFRHCSATTLEVAAVASSSACTLLLSQVFAVSTQWIIQVGITVHTSRQSLIQSFYSAALVCTLGGSWVRQERAWERSSNSTFNTSAYLADCCVKWVWLSVSERCWGWLPCYEHSGKISFYGERNITSKTQVVLGFWANDECCHFSGVDKVGWGAAEWTFLQCPQQPRTTTGNRSCFIKQRHCNGWSLLGPVQTRY